MKTTYEQIIETIKGINKISDIRRAPATSRKLFLLKKALNPAFEFFSEEETKLITELGGTVDTTTSIVTFPDVKKRAEYQTRRQELLDMEEDVETGRIIIHDTELKEISGDEMWMLRHFVDFVE